MDTKEPQQIEGQNQEDNDQDQDQEISKLNELEQRNRIMILLGNKSCKKKEDIDQDTLYENRIELKTELTEMMIKNSMLLKSIPCYNLYFQPILNMGDISVGEITEDNIECIDSISRTGKNEEQKIISLRTRKYNMTCMRYIKEAISTKKWQIYVESFLQTIQILKELEKKKMVHMDIHQDTLLYSVEKGRPILSGFHLLFQIDELMNMESSWEQYFPEFDQYAPWCIDIYLLSKLATIKEKKEEQTSRLDRQTILKWCEEYMNHPKSIYNKLSNMEKRQEYLLNLETHFGGYTNIKSLFEYLIEKSRTWDLHSVCILYLRIAIDTQITNNMEEYDFIKKTIDVLKSVVYSMPDARPKMEYIEKSLLDIDIGQKLDSYLNKMANIPQIEKPESIPESNPESNLKPESNPESEESYQYNLYEKPESNTNSQPETMQMQEPINPESKPILEPVPEQAPEPIKSESDKNTEAIPEPMKPESETESIPEPIKESDKNTEAIPEPMQMPEPIKESNTQQMPIPMQEPINNQQEIKPEQKQLEEIPKIVSNPNYSDLHLCKGDTDCAFQMRNGVQRESNTEKTTQLEQITVASPTIITKTKDMAKQPITEKN